MLSSAEVGKIGEEEAAQYLQKQKYKILARNVQVGKQELDIIAKIKKKIVFVEVKCLVENPVASAADCLGARKIKSLKKAVSRYLYQEKLSRNNFQMDFLAVDISDTGKLTNIKHFQDIF